MRQTNVRGTLSLRGFRKLRTGAIVATGVILLGLGFLAPTVSASEQDGVWVARTVAEVKADIQNIDNLSHYTIKWGDTLSAISGATGLSVDSLVEINRIANRDLIFANNQLYFSEEAFLKDGNTEVKRQQVSIDNSGSRQSYEVETKTDTVTGEQTTTVKQTTPVVVETPAVSAPKSETSVSVAPKAETRSETLNAPSADTTNESGNSTESSTVADKIPSNIGTTNQPIVSNPSSEASAPKAEEPEATTPKSEEPEATTPQAEEPATPAPKAEEPMVSEPKVEEPVSPAPKVEEPMVSEPKAEEPVSPAPKVEEPTVSEPKAEAPVATRPTTAETGKTSVAPSSDSEEVSTTTEETGESTSSDSNLVNSQENNSEVQDGTTNATSEEASESKEASTASEGGSTATQPAVEAGTVSEVATPGATAETGTTEEGTSDVTPGGTGEASTESPEAEVTEPEAALKEDKSEGKVSETSGATEGTPGATGEASETTSDDQEKEAKETEETGTEEAEQKTPEVTTTPSADATNDTTSNGETIDQPVAPSSNSDDSAPKAAETGASGETGTTAQPVGEAGESEKAPSGEAEDNSQNAEASTGDGNSESPKSDSEKPQADEPAVEHKDSEQSLKKETEDSNKAAIDDQKKETEENIKNSNLSEERKKEALEKVEQLTEEYHKKLAEENDTEKQAALVDEYRDKLNEIDTPGAEYDSPDFKRPIESHTGGTTIDENSTVANSALTSSNPSSQPSSSEDSSQTQPAATSDSSTTGNSGFRSAGTYQPRVTRRRRSIEEPQNTVSIYYNFDGMKDIPGFFGDPGEKNDIEIPKDASGEKVKSLIKEKIDAKKSELAKRGYQFSEDIFVEYTHQDATHYDYVVTFTKETTGTTGFRIAPKVQVRAKKVAKRDLSNKTKHINVYYNLTSLKDIAGALGEVGENNLLTLPGNATKEDIKKAVAEKTKAQIEKLKKQGFTVTSKTDLNQIVEGGDSYDYVVEFTKEAKTQPVGTTGFRMAPAVQPRASRNRRSLEQPAPQKVKVNVFYNFDQMKDIAGFLGDINGTSLEIAEGLSNEQVKVAVKSQVDAKKEELSKRGYTFKEDYVYQANGKDYNYILTFSKTK